MGIGSWIIIYLLSALFWLWLLKWGGAEWLEGWKAWAVLGWFSGHWDAEQIRLYAVVLLFFETVWFVIGLFSPGLRLGSLLSGFTG